MKLKRLASFSLSFSLLPLVFSSAVVWISPRGRIARQTDWEVLGLDKWQWLEMHTVMGWFFILLCLFHLYLNWGVIMNYLRDRTTNALGSKKELFTAGVLVLAVCAGTAASIPPFTWVSDAGDTLSEWFNNTDEQE